MLELLSFKLKVNTSCIYVNKTHIKSHNSINRYTNVYSIYIHTYTGIHIYISVHRYSDIHRYHMYMNWPCWEDQWIEHGALVTVLIKRNTIGAKKRIKKNNITRICICIHANR